MGSTDTRPRPIQIPSQPAIDRPSHESKTHEGAGAKAAAEPAMAARTASFIMVVELSRKMAIGIVSCTKRVRYTAISTMAKGREANCRAYPNHVGISN